MAKATSKSTAKKPTTVPAPCYLRAGTDAKDLTSGQINFEGIECTMLVDAKGNIGIHKNVKTALGYAVKPIAKGNFKASNSKAEGVPDLNGFVETKKGSKFRLVAWFHEQNGDEFYVVRYDAMVRKGKLFRVQ